MGFAVRSETKQLNEEAEEMLKKKAVVGLEIAEKQRKITSLQTECSTLKQVFIYHAFRFYLSMIY